MSVTTPASIQHRTRTSAWRVDRNLVALTGVGLALAVVFAVGFLWPLSIWRHPTVVPTAEALATALGTGWMGALRFTAPTVLAFSLFAVALWLARRISGPMAFAVVAAGTLLFSLALVPMNPLGAHDAYYHVGNARTLWIYGENPLMITPAVHADDPFYPNIASWQDFPPAYGPVWYAVSGLFIPVVGDGLWPNVLALKVIAALSLFGATVLAMLIAERLRPGTAVAAGVLVGWNPLLQWETAGNPHNDVLVALFALAALYAVVRRWWIAVFPLLALSIATKYVLVLLVPVLLLWLLRRQDVPRRQIALSLLLGMALGIALYLPFWAGADTFLGFRRQANLISSSPPALLHTVLWSWFPMDGALGATIMKVVVIPPFLIGYVVLLWRVRRDGEVSTLIEYCFWVVFLLLTVVTWWFWPWYLGFLVPLGALLPGSRLALVAAVASAAGMLMYVPHYWLLFENRLVLDGASVAVAFPIPILVALTPWVRTRLARLVLIGVALELVFLVGFLRPLSLKRHPDAVPTSEPLATALGTDVAGALRFAIPTLCAFALFGVAWWLARRLHGRAAVMVVVGLAAVFSLTLLSINPLAGQDIYHNIADARTTWHYGDNPTVLAPITHADDPLYPYVSAWEDYPSVYGPVWYFLSGAPLPVAGDDLWSNILGQKALSAAFLLGTTVLAMLIAERLRPGTAVAAGVLVGWNPLLQWETAGNAHNDIIMIFFALAALYALVQRWWIAVFPLLALSIATKYVLVLLAPILLVWLLCRRDVPRRQVVLSLLLGLALGIVLYLPFWAGTETLTSFTREGANPTSSPGALLYALLSSWAGFDRAEASTTIRLILLPLYGVAWVLLLRRVARDSSVVGLLSTAFWVVFLFLLMAKWWFWPWYLLWLVPIGALLPRSRLAGLALVFSATAMCIYLPYYWLMRGDAFRILVRDAVLPQGAIVAVGFVLPALVALMVWRFHRLEGVVTD